MDRANENPGVKIAAAISKKAGNAVWRNRVRRLIKESYRLNKLAVLTKCQEKKMVLKIIFSANFLNEKNNKTIKYNDISKPVLDIINRIENEI